VSRDPFALLPVFIDLSRAVSFRALYPPEHPRVEDVVGAVIGRFEEVLAEQRREELTLLVVEEEIIIDERPLRRRRSQLRPLQRAMRRQGVQHIRLARGAEPQEVLELVDGLVGKVPLRSTAHVGVGHLEVGAAEASSLRSLPLSEEALDRGQYSFLRVPAKGEASIDELDRLVWQLMDGLAEASRSMLLLAPLKGYHEQTFVHSINVALLTLAQARYLGIEGPVLHDIGLAAMLHDIGKLWLPPPLLEKRGRLESEEEWKLFQQHPVLGAMKLSGIEGVSPLAVLVAYEHHLRWDGAPSYPSVPMGRAPNLASQITAVADTYDVMVASRAVAGSAHHEVALEIWRQRAGTWLDPFLVGNLVLLLGEHDRAATAPGEAESLTVE
jgi:HD-GYP domain-containing protein (c-di-GMP phosphodiesterase class II)